MPLLLDTIWKTSDHIWHRASYRTRHMLKQELLKLLRDSLANMRLLDYKVRILTPNAGTEALTRVMIESGDGSNGGWTTVGVSTNVIDASYNALNDSITYKLFRDGARTV